MDLVDNIPVALKVIKSHSTYTQQAKKEIDLLLEVNEDDENDEYGMGRRFSPSFSVRVAQ